MNAADFIKIGDRVLPVAALLSQSVLATIGSDQTALDIGYSPSVLAVSSAAYSVGGFAPDCAFAGRTVKIYNNGAYVLRIKHQDSTATAGNRIICPYGLDWPMRPADCFEFWYDATASRWRLVDGWQRILIDSRYGSEFHDDFIAGNTAVTTSGIVSWNSAVSGGGLLQGNFSGSNNGFGFAKMSCQTLASRAAMSSSAITRIRHGFVFETQISVETLSTGSERANFLIGMATTNATTISPADGIYFIYDKNVSDNILCGTSASSSPTVTASIVPLVANTFLNLRWVLNSARSNVDFFINDMLTPAVSITATIPTAATALHPFAIQLKALGSATFNSTFVESWHGIRVDYSSRY